MGGGSPDPDPAQQELARAQAQNMKDQLQFNKDTFDWMKGYATRQDEAGQKQYDQQYALQQKAMDWANQDRDFYYSTTGNQVRKFADAADAYDTDANRQFIAGQAMADVEAQTAANQAAMERNMQARGINPGSAMYYAQLADNQMAGALAKAGAATTAREAARREGLNLRSTAAGLGSAFGQSASSGLGQASGFGMSGLSALGSGLNAAQMSAGTYNSGQGVANSFGQSANQGYTDYNKAQQAAAASKGQGMAMLGKIAGGVAGSFFGPMGASLGASLGGSLFRNSAGGSGIGSDRRLKTDITLVGKLDNGLNVYSYRYKAGGPYQIGVMADEVAQIVPEAYLPGGAGGGYDAVDYSKLGV